MNKKDHLNNPKKKKDEDKEHNHNDKNPPILLNEIIDTSSIDICQNSFLNPNIIHSPVILTRTKTRRSQDNNSTELQLPRRISSNSKALFIFF